MSGVAAERDLIEAAWETAERAYAPYSKFRVGAVLATPSGRIFTGCNVENASYGMSICAGRAAVCKAVSEGERDFEVLAICGPGGAPPCGACRQVLHEFSPGLLILIANEHKTLIAKHKLADLLPINFGPESLDI